MSASTLPQGPGRLGLSLALIAAALSGLGGGATAAQTAPPAAHVCASQCLQQRFFAAVEGWRKLAKKMPEQQSHEADLVRVEALSMSAVAGMSTATTSRLQSA